MSARTKPRSVSVSALALASLLPLAACATTLDYDTVAFSRYDLAPADDLDVVRKDFFRPYANVLRRVVATGEGEQGLVDYESLVADPEELEEAYARVAARSPRSHPDLFPTAEDQLAYWLNAYNLTVLRLVIDYYPIDSVHDVGSPLLFPGFLFEDGAGFFYWQEPVFGGEPMDLLTVENEIIRSEFDDPRIHFALNCASTGCPRLLPEPFDGASLSSQLDRATIEWFGEERNLRVDDDGSVWMSQILDWYREDFLTWLDRNDPTAPRTLLEYAARHLDSASAQRLRSLEPESIRFVGYDWSLNRASR
ncbi:MAG: DUF547 domain-containing protein [Planctomycetota bacterium]